MTKTTILLGLTVLCGGLQAQIADSTNPVIEWNKTLLTIVRTPGAQPPTIHSTRNFAMLHVAMFDAVNDVAAGFSPYLVRNSTEARSASSVVAARDGGQSNATRRSRQAASGRACARSAAVDI